MYNVYKLMSIWRAAYDSIVILLYSIFCYIISGLQANIQL